MGVGTVDVCWGGVAMWKEQSNFVSKSTHGNLPFYCSSANSHIRPPLMELITRKSQSVSFDNHKKFVQESSHSKLGQVSLSEKD